MNSSPALKEVVLSPSLGVGVIRLNLGGRGTQIKGFQTVDLSEEHDVQIKSDVSDLRMFEEGTVDEIYASQILGRAGLPNTMHGAACDFSQDPLLSRVAGAAGHSETFGYDPNRTNFSEGDLRRGSLRGPGGQVMQPGFETRRGR